MSRLNQILSVILVVQIALVGLVFFWPQTTAEAGGGPLIPDFSASDVTGLTISDNEDNRLVLAKSGTEWVLPEADDFPADGEKITPILEKIAGIKSSGIRRDASDMISVARSAARRWRNDATNCSNVRSATAACRSPPTISID